MSSVADALNAGLEEKELACQRVGCDARYIEAKNTPNCCRYHPGAPLFHDGSKEWSCCNQKSHDFSLFLAIKGCAVGEHTQEKPQKPAPSPNAPSAPQATKVTSTSASDADSVSTSNNGTADCPRCRQGFFCSDHQGPKGVKVAGVMPQKAPVPKTPAADKSAPVEVDPHTEQTCKNKACGVKFKEVDNHDEACSFHPGPAIFHERKKGWGCCDVHSHDFDEFLRIAPCTKGRHSAIET
mmetsp:Transcript_9851/g.13372  ORF Transcript_9851/g.13372 Transcript_9851/m.13372 type:complete len:239 (+) Transcript_9851:151-867(+)